MDLNIVNLYPDNPGQPRSWRSQDAADPQIALLRRSDGGWDAKLEKHTVARAGSAEQLAAHLYGEYGLLTVLNGNGIEA